MSLNHEDLRSMILPVVSIDEFEPKAGPIEEVIVVAFYVKDQSPAEDLNTFLQRSFVDTLDVEVSPNTDLEGRYLVFVEMGRNPTFPEKFKALLKDVQNLSGDIDWEIKTYLSGDQTFDLAQPELFNYVILDPKLYISKEKFMKESAENNLKEFLQDSFITHLQVAGNLITIGNGKKVVEAELVDIGEYDQVVGRNLLSESAFNLSAKPMEATVLESFLNNCDVTRIDRFFCVSKRLGNSVMLLKNLELKY